MNETLKSVVALYDAQVCECVRVCVCENEHTTCAHSCRHSRARVCVCMCVPQELIKRRQEVSNKIRTHMTLRAKAFNIVLDDVSITHLTFGTEYRQVCA
jgi:hypothetical protein